MKKPVEVSLILCGYNAESTMEKSLDSAIAQTLNELEILCVNDGSSDRTGEIYRRYAEKDSRIRVIDHPVNKGLLAARQTGVNNASGKYIMFLDLDDALEPDACRELALKMDETGYDILQFEPTLVFASEEERQAREKSVAAFFSNKRTDPLAGSDAILESCFLKMEFGWHVWSKIYRTPLARKVYSHVPENMKVVMAEDTFAFFVAASLAESLAFIPHKYYKYSFGSGVSSANDPKHEERSLQVFYALIKPFAERYSSPTGRLAADKLGKYFRSCLSCRLRSTETLDPYKEIADREIRTFGPDMAALTFAENWNLFGMHPLKTVFLGLGSGLPSRPAKEVRKIGIIETGQIPDSSLPDQIQALQEAGYAVRLFARIDLIRAAENRLPGCDFTILPEDESEIKAYFSDIPVKKKNDIYILSYGSDPEYDMVSFLLFQLRFCSQALVFLYLGKDAGQLNCYDKIYLSAADCVLRDKSSDTSALFGRLGIFCNDVKNSIQLKKIISAFAGGKDSGDLSEARKCMHAAANAALASLGFIGFGKNTPLNRAEVEQKIAASGCFVPVEDYCLMRESGFFDDEFYRRHFPGCTIDDPILHYCQTGMTTLAAPSAIFNPKLYCLENPDLYAARHDINLIVHYLRHGILENRKISSPIYATIRDSGYFDEDQYREKHGEELDSLDPLSHYLLIGWRKGYLPSERFVDKYYCELYLEFSSMISNPLYHFLRWGKKEGRCPFPLKPRQESYFPEGFDEAAFRQRKGKYLIVIHQLDFTGVPILAKMIAEIFSKEQSAAIISPMDGPLRKACLEAGIPVLIDSDFYIHQERAAFYKEKGFGVCLFNTLGVIKPYLRTAGTIPSILWIHDNLPKSFLPENIHERIELAPTVFATSRTTLDYVREYNPGVRYLPYPVKDMSGHHKQSAPRKFRFGVMGVYYERKGQHLAIEAFKSLPADLKARAELLLIGNPVSTEYAEKLQTMAEGKADIHFIPAVKNSEAYHRLYENLEVQICPSLTDPMPLVVFDGMMHGCPVILSDTVGQSEFIRNGENGYVFPAEDAAALRDCMVRMIENPDGFTRMSQASRQTFLDRFEQSRAARTIRRVLDEVKSYF